MFMLLFKEYNIHKSLMYEDEPIGMDHHIVEANNL